MKGVGWLFLFFADGIIHLLSIHYCWIELRYATKPLLTLLLGLFVFQSLKRTPLPRIILLSALGLSGAGDIFLLFEDKQPVCFIPGLACFLLAHIFYIFLFIKLGKIYPGFRKNPGRPAIPVTIYTLGLFLLIRPGLGALEIPVIIYACALAFMLISGLSVFDFSKKAGRFAITGAVLFVISDSLLAINKFSNPFPEAAILVMLTYSLAQFFIASGVCFWIKTKTGANDNTEPGGRRIF